ncbi:ribosomal protein S7 domain-containing protein [Aspergillus pseudoustus]|uniref:Ribosomal protein S7 domain-containing protein n=1 Tax=Aspergillus pseudoustus TaxID=1810923 RepID=A0ABR4JRU8_9EURO
MPPLLNLFAARTAASTVRISAAPRRSVLAGASKSHSALSQRRWNSSGSDGKKEAEEAQRAATSMPHVSEEAAEVSRIMEKEKRCDGVPATPELEQGTMVSEILSRDKEAAKHAPKVFQDQIRKAQSGSRSFSTSARRGQLEEQKPSGGVPAGSKADDAAHAAFVQSMITQVTEDAAAAKQELAPGLKFPAPETLPRTENYRSRYEPLLEQFTKLIMRDGKLGIAEKNMYAVLDHLRTSPPPNINPRRPLLTDLPAPQLPLNPVKYLTIIVDSVAPLIKNKPMKGLVGGGASVPVPVPLVERQRRRAAIKWIIDASDKRRDTKFAQRLANELVAVAEGRGGVWDKRDLVYKVGIQGRALLGQKPKTRVIRM